MIKIIGTDHLIPAEEIIRMIKDETPEIIGVELCQLRLNALIVNPVKQEVEDETLIGKISSSIRKKAEEQKIVYGSDMITASKYALENNIPLILVDRDVNEIKQLMEKIPVNEKQGFMQELAKFQTENLNREVDENKVLEELRIKYPVAYEFLIVSREMYILNQILKTLINNPNKKILVFLGRGHAKRIEEELI